MGVYSSDAPWPSLDEALAKGLAAGIWTEADVAAYRVNYHFFVLNQIKIRKRFPGQFVASIGGALYAANSLQALHAITDLIPGHNRGYIEQVPDA